TQDLVEGQRLLLHVVLVIGLLDDRKCRDELRRNDIGEQLAAKRRARYLRTTQIFNCLVRGAQQKFLPTADESRVEGVFSEGQVDDRLRGLDDFAPLLVL